ncbi:MAG: ATP-binding protein [Marinospirillum sp.]|uniref:ATP-binding protein n=1 Tax=Marinospirillum sp. TaxID=2183934 RepID=UPI001A022768|nr:ATP-binding protein [Marinospirillum sp.]MBE0506137.1 ATP-binding protein [Marinospirillum sp.]
MSEKVARKKLPIGIQTFADIREDGYYYVDKTPHIHRLVEEGKYYFLSRPRRFGKSLLLDTIDCLFSGREQLFEGLYIKNRWDWNKKYPVIRISFGSGVLTSREQLDQRIREQLYVNRQRLGVEPDHATDIAGEFAELIRLAHSTHSQRVVVLIDEYDKPILDNILDSEKAREQREGLKNLYSVLKDSDEHLAFVLLTGVSKFSKVSLFSGLNNLRDITLSAQYTSICGYTDEDIDQVFTPELAGLDRTQIKHWYNGYRWGGSETTSVYNPFDLLLLFQERVFEPYWFETATPTFLVDVLKKRGIFTPRLDQMETEQQLLGQFDVDAISTEGLLFQTGYLTIQKHEEPLTGYHLYTLGYPNQEVETSLNQVLLPVLGLQEGPRERRSLLTHLKKHDLKGLEEHLKALFAGLPHDWYRNNPIAQYEGHYASVFYSHFAALGVQVTVEDASNYGKVDMTVAFDGHIYLFEFKVVEQVQGNALQQIKDKGYADKYRASGQQLHLIGVEFSREQRQILVFEVETVSAA